MNDSKVMFPGVIQVSKVQDGWGKFTVPYIHAGLKPMEITKKNQVLVTHPVPHLQLDPEATGPMSLAASV